MQGANKVAKAQAYLRTMNEFAAKTPFTTENALSLSKYMQAVGVSMNTTKSFLGVITDTAAATGATEEKPAAHSFWSWSDDDQRSPS